MTPAKVSWFMDTDTSPDREHGHPYRIAGGIYACDTCGEPLADVALDYRTAVSDDGTEAVEQVSQRRVTGRPGVVNETRRHPSGARWFVSRGGDRPGLTIKMPSVITCRAGHDNKLD